MIVCINKDNLTSLILRANACNEKYHYFSLHAIGLIANTIRNVQDAVKELADYKIVDLDKATITKESFGTYRINY